MAQRPRGAQHSNPHTGRGPIVDMAAPLYLVLYLLVVLAPFEALIGYQLSIPTFLVWCWSLCAPDQQPD